MESTFVYSPQIEVHLQTADGTIYDVSDDITQAQVSRIINGVSSAQLTLANAGRKYDNVFAEMDKIAIYLTRIKRLLVFTGYLDLVPAFTSNPVSVNIQASCTLKRLQNWFWDPSTSAAQKLLYNNPASSDRFDLTDGGLAQRTVDLLTQVSGWPKAQIHIGAVPEDWFNAIAGVANRIIAEATKLSMIAEVGSNGYVNGINPFTNGDASIPGIGKGTGDLPQVSGGFALYDSISDQLDTKATKPSGAYFATMAWPYLQGRSSAIPGGHASGVMPVPGVDVTKARSWWSDRRLLLVNPQNGKSVCVKACGWGPSVDPNLPRQATRIIGSTSQQVLLDLGATKGTDQLPLHVAFAPAGMKLGKQVVSASTDINQGQGLAQSNAAAKGNSSVNFANTAAGWATSSGVNYGWGDGHPGNGADPHPSRLDCSGLVNWSMARNGQTPSSLTSAGWAGTVKRISMADAKKTKGALVFLSNNGAASGTHHVGISMGDGTTAEARTEGEVGTYPFDGAHSNSWSFAGIIPSLDYAGAVGTGTGGKAGQFSTGSGGGTGTGTTGTTSLDGNIGTSLYNVWQWVGNQSFGGDLLAGARALMNDEPVMNTVNSLMTTGLRQYCSAPNGDFIGWFPDYFGWWGTAGKMVIQKIEILEDFAIARSDINMKTHWFTTSATTGVEGAGDATTIAQEYATAGIASVEMPDLMKALFRITHEFDDNGAAFLARFGARPQFDPMDNISGHRQEFFFAVFRFMLNWATRWSAPINVTFMPELYPGMLAVFPDYGIQCYVQEVTHSINLRTGGGFTTSFSGIAWSSIGNQSGMTGLAKGAPLT
jgi:cell wall-associated NlpC family hydrolase